MKLQQTNPDNFTCIIMISFLCSILLNVYQANKLSASKSSTTDTRVVTSCNSNYKNSEHKTNECKASEQDTISGRRVAIMSMRYDPSLKRSIPHVTYRYEKR